MSETKEDGGPAYPTTIWEEKNGVQHGAPHPGMSLRDWLAGMALHSMGSFLTEFESHDQAAREAFKYADAMLKARKEG